MAIIVKDRVKETSTTTGTGTVTLAGAVAGFQAFSVIGNSNQTYYAITDGNGTGFEVGIGTYTSSGSTLSRDTILESSNSGSAITLTSNTHTVFTTYPAERAVFSDDNSSTVSGTADGAITAGKPVIVEADGDFAEVVSSSGFGTALEIDSASAYFTDTDSDNDGTFLVVYRGASNYGYATVVTISGTTVTAGTPTAFESSTTQYPRVSYDASQSKYLVCWQDYSNTSLQGIVATVTGTSVSFGTKDEGDSDCIYKPLDTLYDSDAEKHWVAYNTSNTDAGLEIVIATVSGTSISWGTAQALSSGSGTTYPGNPKIVYNSDDTMAVIGYYEADYTSGSVFKFCYHGATVSGTVMTFGTKVTQDGYIGSSDNINIAYDSSVGVFVTFGTEYDDGNNVYSNVITNSGTTLTLGTKGSSIFQGTNLYLISTVSGKVMGMTGYNYDPDGDITAWEGTVGATSVSWGSPITVATVDGEFSVMSNNSNDGNMIFVYKGSSNELLARGYLLAGTNLTDSNFLGFALSTVADTETVTVQVSGKNTSVSGLTTASTYYVQTDGTLSTSAGSPSVQAGKALSATSILVKG